MPLASFAGRHAGESILVAACGPSLRDCGRLIELRAASTIVGVNDVGRWLQPDYLLILDAPGAFGERFAYVRGSRARALFVPVGIAVGPVRTRVVRFKLTEVHGTNLDVKGLPAGSTSPYTATCLAALLGARRIGLLGVDFGPDYRLRPQLAELNRAYGRLADKLAARGVELVNLGAGSSLSSVARSSVAAWCDGSFAAP